MSSREDLKARNVDLELEDISLRRALKQAQGRRRDSEDPAPAQAAGRP